jgi:GDP-L-fucose synthase
MSSSQQRIFVAGHTGMVGSAIKRKLEKMGHESIVTRSSSELDLTNQAQVEGFLSKEAIDIIYLAAAKVGGIHANNTYPADFIYDNMAIECNVIHAAHKSGVQQLLFLGSSCIYPREAEQPMTEEALLTGPLEPTNEPYAVAKIAGIKLCESYNRQHGRDYRSVMPTNLYGSGDNFDLETSHVVAALIRKIHLGKCLEEDDWETLRKDLNKRPVASIDGNASNEKILETLAFHGISYSAHHYSLTSPPTDQHPQTTVNLWGTGTPRREFLNVDDAASACVHLMNLDRATYEAHTHPQYSHINVGTGEDCTIRELAETIQDIVGYKGQITFDTTMPDGAPRKLLDVSRLMKLGWKSSISLNKGLEDVYKWYVCMLD